MGVFGAAWALMQLVFAPIFGNLSDRFGRRPVLLVSMFGLAFDYLVMALAPTIAWLFVGRLISGITASSGSAAGAYVADVSTPENRARNFGRFQAAANAGILLGPALGGFVGVAGPARAVLGRGGAGLANGLYGLFVLPESLSPRAARAVPLAAGQPDRRGRPADQPQGAARHGADPVPRPVRRLRRSTASSSSTPTSASAGGRRRSPCC